MGYRKSDHVPKTISREYQRIECTWLSDWPGWLDWFRACAGRGRRGVRSDVSDMIVMSSSSYEGLIVGDQTRYNRFLLEVSI